MKSVLVGNAAYGWGIEGKYLFGLIIQRSVVQIHPPQLLKVSPLIRNFGLFPTAHNVMGVDLSCSFQRHELVTARWDFAATWTESQGSLSSM